MNKKRILSILALVLVVSLTGCAFVDSFVGKLTGSLFGKGYTITQYDDYGNLVFTVHGDKVTMDCQLDEYGEVTSYIEIPADLPKTTLINIDGKMVYVHRANVDIIPAELFGE